MQVFWHILVNNTIPLGVMIAIGIILERVFRLDIRTLSKLNFYLFSPAIMFKMLYESKISAAVLFQVLLFFFVYIGVLALLVEAVVRLRGYSGGMRSAMRNSVLFYNSGNYAIPLNQLVFHNNPFTLSIQIIISMMQSLLPNTYGVYSVNSHRMPFKQTLKTILSLPVIYAIPLAFLMRGFEVPIPAPLYTPLNYIADGFIVTALVTLGVQLGAMKWTFRLGDVLISNSLRLLAGPALGWLIVWLMGFEGEMAAALIVSCAVPTSLTSVLLAVEFDNEPEFASQAVFTSTALSMITMTAVIYLLHSSFVF